MVAPLAVRNAGCPLQIPEGPLTVTVGEGLTMRQTVVEVLHPVELVATTERQILLSGVSILVLPEMPLLQAYELALPFAMSVAVSPRQSGATWLMLSVGAGLIIRQMVV